MRVAAPTIAAVLTLVWSAPPAVAQAPARFSPADMLALEEFARGSEPVISPDGEMAAYATVDAANETNIRAFRPTAFLRVVATGGGEPRRVTGENAWGDIPVWSPDSRFLAFVQTDRAGNRLAVWERASGQIRPTGVTLPPERQGLPSAALPPQWTSDSRTLIVPVADPDGAAAEKPRVRVLKSTDPIVPGDARFTDSRRWRLVAVDRQSGRQRRLTPDGVALRGFQVSSDGAHVLFRAVTPETLGRFRKEEIRTFVAPVSADRAPWPALPGRTPSWIVFSPDGSSLLFQEEGALKSVPISGGDERVVLENLPARSRQPLVTPHGWLAVLAPRPGTGPEDRRMYSILRPVDDLLAVDVRAAAIVTVTDPAREDEIDEVTWSGDGRTLVYRAVDPDSYRETLMRWRVGTNRPEPLLSGDEAFGAISVSSSGESVAFTAMTATRPADGFVLDGGTRRRLTDLNPDAARFGFVAPETFDFHSADGRPLRGLLYKPAGASADRPVPVVTFVYEKLTPQKHRFNPEAQLHVAHGYAYLMPDVLIAPGYTGESFVKSVVPAVNAVRSLGFTTGRFGITGGSFGGYAGLFLISHVDIFSAAVLRAPPSEFFSTWGSGRDRDIWTIETGQARTGGTPWEVPERYVANSPFFQADRVKTPVLILHGEKDFTVPFQQGEIMFHALRALGRTAEFAIYREGDHSIVRGSRDDFLDMYQRTLAWWDRFLRDP